MSNYLNFEYWGKVKEEINCGKLQKKERHAQKKINQQVKRDNERLRRLSWFEGDYYQEKFIDGFWWIKRWDGGRERWCVDKYPVESYTNYCRGREKIKAMNQERQELKYQIMKE